MLQNNEKTAEVLMAEKIVEQAKARLAEAKRKASQQKRKEENQLNNPVPVSLLSGDRKPQIRFLGNHHSGSGNLYHKSFRM